MSSTDTIREGRRSCDFLILRTCERLHCSEAFFLNLSYAEQLRLLAYNDIRTREEFLALGHGSLPLTT